MTYSVDIKTTTNIDYTVESASDYYPYGKALRSYGKERYQSTYHERDLESGFDYRGARFYDGNIVRFNSLDPLAAEFPEWSDYNYVLGNPNAYTDPDGKCPTCPTAAAGGLIGGLIGGGIEIGRQLWNNGTITNWNAVGGSVAQGAITGAAAGFTAGASLVTTAAVAGGANAVGGTVNRTMQGQETTVSNVVIDGTIGAGLGVVGNKVGNAVNGKLDGLSNQAKGKVGETVTRVKYGAQGYKDLGKAQVPTGGTTPTGRVQQAHYDHLFEHRITGKQITVESKFNTSGFTKNQNAAKNNVQTSGGLKESRTTSKQLGNAAQVTTIGVGAGAAAQLNKKNE